MAFTTAFGRGAASSGRRDNSSRDGGGDEWGSRPPPVAPYDQRNDNRRPPPPVPQSNASRQNPPPPQLPRGGGVRLINQRDNNDIRPPPNYNDPQIWRPRSNDPWQERGEGHPPHPDSQMRQPFPRPVTREQSIYGPPPGENRLPTQNRPPPPIPTPSSQPIYARPPPTSNNIPDRRMDNIPPTPRERPPPSNHFDRLFDEDQQPSNTRARVQQPMNDSYIAPPSPYEQYDRVRTGDSTQLSNATHRDNGYPPYPGQHLPTLHEERDADRFRQQPPPPGLRLRNNQEEPVPPPLPYGREPRQDQQYSDRRTPPPPQSPFNQSVRSSVPPNAYAREAQFAREPIHHSRPPHDYRSTAPSPVPSMRSHGAPSQFGNPYPEQENRRRDFHNYFEVPPSAASRQPPPMSNNDGYYQPRQQPPPQNIQRDEPFNQNRNVITPPPFGSFRGGYGGASNPRGGFNNSRGGGYGGVTNGRNEFNGMNDAGDGLNSGPRNHRYDDRRNANTPPPMGYGGLQHLDSQSTDRNRAPRNYVPLNRNVEEIFAEDSEEVTRHANTIFEGDADIEVEGDNTPLRCENWNDMRLDQQLLNNILKSEYRKPRNIQQYVIPYMMEKFNLRCQSETGSGKSAAFLIPMIDNMIKLRQQKPLANDGPIGLVIAPTRELAFQLCEQAKKFADGTGITVSYAYGQIDSAKNKADIRRGCNILCATLGRLMDFVEASHVSLRYVRYLVIDEADRLMDSREDKFGLLNLLNYPQLPRKEDRQTCLFSATLKDPVVNELAHQYVDNRDGKQVFIIAKNESNARIRYVVLAVPSLPAKFRYLMQYLKEITEKNNGECPRVLVFVNRKINVDRVAVDITQAGFPATTIHGDRGQDLREEALRSFRSGKTRCLVATDVCARGVDIKDLDFVINYDLPNDRTGFVQRCGRTGRTHRGVAVSFYCESVDINMAQIIDGIIHEARQESPAFLRNGVKDGDFIYDEPKNAYTTRQENDRSPLDDQRDSGYSRNNSPFDELQQNIPDNDVDSEWN